MANTAKKSTRTPDKPEEWAGSAGSWKKRGAPHRITLPSGQRVLAHVLGLGAMASIEGLPTDLTDAVYIHVGSLENGGLPALIGAEASLAADGNEEAAERYDKHVSEFARLTKHLVAKALVEPSMTVEELDQVPLRDLEMLMQIVTARQPFDAEGVRIGVEPVESWATFRDKHGCPPDCEACVEARRHLSSLLFDRSDEL